MAGVVAMASVIEDFETQVCPTKFHLSTLACVNALDIFFKLHSFNNRERNCRTLFYSHARDHAKMPMLLLSR